MTRPQPREGGRAGRHPDFGLLIRDEEADTVICHVCGRAFRSLGAHVRVHGMTAAEYRQEFGLLRSRALSARSFSAEQSRTSRAGYQASEEAQARFARGRAMARSGELSRRRWNSAADQADPDELRRVRDDSLTAGRRIQAQLADDRLKAALHSGGFADLAQALRSVYVDGQHSIEDTARVLAVGKGRLRRLLVEHGIEVRSAGQNSTAGRRSRVQLNDRATAERVGTQDITAWLRERTAEGATLSRSAPTDRPTLEPPRRPPSWSRTPPRCWGSSAGPRRTRRRR
ncbi:MucR family transcriptional regulator [Streptomyces sp. NPDC057623]|uniref:MucR family transcriptional regulator n=1 Tax=Streptomyces sp. NPDC057623 TaxID=3346187 RepID=UPI0036A27678